MKYAELPKKYQKQAAQWAVEAWNEIYREQGIPEIDETAPEVQEFLDEHEYVIERGQYEPGVPYERLDYKYD